MSQLKIYSFYKLFFITTIDNYNILKICFSLFSLVEKRSQKAILLGRLLAH